MFGLYRYGLAFCVAASHLWAGMIPGPAAYAVWGFYCLSGYLMTLILNEKYGFSPRGVVRFAVNRALRIYPGYYAVCVVMFLVLYFLPRQSETFLPILKRPVSRMGWIYSLSLVSTPDGQELLHGSRALRVELWYYVAIALGLGRGRRIAITWFAASLAYTVYLLATNTPFGERYIFIPACSLAFSTGCLVYHLRDRIPRITTPWAAVAAASIWWLHVWFSLNIPGGPTGLGLYTSLAASVFAMITLMRLESKTLPGWMARLDQFAGNLSYPIYLCHWAVGILLTAALPGTTRANPIVVLLGFPLVNAGAYLIYRFVEHPLQALKRPSLKQSQPRPLLMPAGAVHGPHFEHAPRASLGVRARARTPLAGETQNQ